MKKKITDSSYSPERKEALRTLRKKVCRAVGRPAVISSHFLSDVKASFVVPLFYGAE